MAYHFSANQFEQAYTAKRLGNWELPKWYPPRPRRLKCSKRFIANDRGYLLDCAKKVNANPWSTFRSTYELPKKLTREFADYYNECLLGRYKWSNFPRRTFTCPDGTKIPPEVKKPECPKKCETAAYLLSFDGTRNYQLHPCEKTEYNKKNPNNLEYTPGDFTHYNQQHASRNILLTDKYELKDFHDKSFKSPVNKFYLEEPDRKLESINIPSVKISTPLPQTTALINSSLSPRVPIDHIKSPEDSDNNLNKMLEGCRSITEKPNERCPSPVIPAYANFELARRMHQTNLDHQPLPDCVTDAAFRRLQITGSNPGLALDINPIATGVGVKTCNAGPTHCTKMKVFRPRTSGVVPRGACLAYANDRISSAHRPTKKMNAIDLAICWDYKPSQESTLTRHIDGTNETAGPAVFTCVKPSPRAESVVSVGSRSGGVFSNTLGERTFFDKDLMKRKLDFTGRRIDPAPYSNDDQLNLYRSRRVPCDTSLACLYNDDGPLKRCGKQYHSTPNILNDHEYKNLRQKYLGDDWDLMPTLTATTTEAEPTTCKRYNFLRKARSRFCHKVAPEPQRCNISPTITNAMCPPNGQSSHNCRLPCKAAFRTGIPHYSAGRDFITSMHNGCCLNGHYHNQCNYNHNRNHHHHSSSQKVLVVPQPRIPYPKRNYNISTLVPPFTSYGGGAKQGGYPEHWRLASVYQHAYKPLDHRKRSFMETVFK